MEAAASIVTLVEVTAKIAIGCLTYIKGVRAASADKLLLEKEINSLLGILDDVKQLLNGPNRAKLSSSQKLRNAVVECQSQLSKLEAKVKPKKPRKIAGFDKFRSALKWPFESKEFGKRLHNMEQSRKTIFLALQIDQTAATLRIEENQDSAILSTVLSHLPSADGASFDSHANEGDPKCHPDTRSDILQQIFNWATDQQSQAIFWLNGMAGTGKSTISRTVAQTLAGKDFLGASFFFKRGEGDRGHAARFFTTIIAQMVSKFPMLLEHVKKAIEVDPDLVKKALTEQFEKLILEPLLELTGRFPTAQYLAIVIDALDECEREQDIKAILHLLARTKTIQSINLRIFDDHNQSLSTSDSLLPPDWPGQRRLDILVNMALPLFIFAATMCRFVGDPRFHPESRLELVLKYQTAAQTSKFDKTYLPVLDQLLTGLDEDEKEAMLAEFEEVVGSIIILTEPLSTNSLENLLGLEKPEVDRRLKMLHSVLNVPSNQDSPVRLLHLSFRDFLIDPNKRGKSPFFLDEMNQHKRVASRCLDLLSRPGVLRTDICDMKAPGTFRMDIDSKTINMCLPNEVKYACRHWVYHLEKSGDRIRDGDQVDRFLRERFIHWLEGLALIGRISEAIPMIRTLLNLTKPGESEALALFLNDARRFVLRNRQILDTAPLQVYSSALAFAPETSVVKRQFKDHIPSWIRRVSGVPTDWGNTLQTIEVSTAESFGKVGFSRDNKLLAGGTNEGVILWDAETGEERQKFQDTPPSGYPYDFAFAWHSDLLAVASPSSIQVIRLSTGIVLQKLYTQYKEASITVLFSPNDKVLASRSPHAIHLWDPDLGELLQTIETSDDLLYNHLCFSGDSSYLAFTSGKWIKVWDIHEKRLLRTFTGHKDRVLNFSFSHNGDIVSISYDVIKIWNPATEEALHSFEDHDPYTRSAFSANRKLFVYSPYGYILIRESSSGKLLRKLSIDDLVSMMAFAENDGFLVIASESIIIIQDLGSDSVRRVLRGHEDTVRSIALSGDTKLLGSASAPRDNTVKLWDLNITKSDAKDVFFIHSIALSKDGKLLAASQYNHGTTLYDNLLNPKLFADERFFSHLVFSEDNRFLTTFSPANKAVTLSDLSNGKTELLLDLSHIETYGTSAGVFSRDGKIFALSVPPDQRIYLCNLEKKTAQLLQKPGTGEPCKFSDDGTLLASKPPPLRPPYIYVIALHDVATGKHLRDIETSCLIRKETIAFSKDSKLLVIHDFDTVELRDIATGAKVGTVEAGTGFWEIGGSPDDFSSVETEAGLLNIPNITTVTQPASERQPVSKLHFHREWVIRNGERFLWVPPEYRPDYPTRMDFRNNTFLWGSLRGVITVVEIECP
ncbi:hypothetical protein EMPG_16628 [Blastomyces silverae]|uniref:Nephrocystin 3-like N-terminal domain-containing protein n=1 Tax=Blastomyces silverae TaxID=2060906 RepID=A0A0H1B955_9EURO|nr:hypothetical protein EMPG_16628 [Blastomyces silverae]